MPARQRKPPKSYDWKTIEAEYVSSSDAVTYRVLCAKYGFNLGLIGKVAKREKWTEKREQFRERAKNRLLKKAQTKEVELQAQQFSLAQGLVAVAVAALKGLDPRDLSPQEIRLFIQAGCELNQRALLMNSGGDDGGTGLDHDQRIERIVELLRSRGVAGA